MVNFVIDANIALDWISSEDPGPVYRLIRTSKISAHAPCFLLIECINVLFWKKKATRSEIEEFLKTILDIGINFHQDVSSLEIDKLISLVCEYKLTSYGAQYLFLAQKLDCKLISLDNDLLKVKKWVIGTEKVEIGTQ